jgi:hypothetical protein
LNAEHACVWRNVRKERNLQVDGVDHSRLARRVTADPMVAMDQLCRGDRQDMAAEGSVGSFAPEQQAKQEPALGEIGDWDISADPVEQAGCRPDGNPGNTLIDVQEAVGQDFKIELEPRRMPGRHAAVQLEHQARRRQIQPATLIERLAKVEHVVPGNPVGHPLPIEQTLEIVFCIVVDEKARHRRIPPGGGRPVIERRFGYLSVNWLRLR